MRNKYTKTSTSYSLAILINRWLLSNEICDTLHENSVMFRDTDILPDNTYTHVNNGSQTCSWLDHIAMSMFCPSLLLTATPSGMVLVQITVLLQLRLTLTANEKR